MLYAEDFSPNTPQGACANCHGLGRVFEVTEKAMVPDPSLTIRERAIAAWPLAWGGQNLRDILVSLGYDVDTPWRDLPKKDRDWILYTDEQPTAPVYAGFTPRETRAALRSKMEPSYQGTFTGARRYVLHTFATTQSALMKKRVSRFMVGGLCPVCDGKRLKREALSVRFQGIDIGTLSQMSLNRVADLLTPVAAGRFDETRSDKQATLSRAAARRDTTRRVAAGGSAHQAAPDVRRTPRTTCLRASQACRNSVSAICRWTAARPPYRPANCSACASPRRFAPIFLASSMCSTNPRRDCIRPTARR